jgi:hypothetical protein
MKTRHFAAAALAALIWSSASARIDITLDAEALNELLTSMAPDHVDVDLAGGRSLTIQLKDLKVTGFDPAAGPYGGLNTSLRMLVPDLGIDIPVTPHLTLDIATEGGKKATYLRFDKVMLNLPLTGAVDVASLLPPLSLVPNTAWVIDSAKGKVRVRPDLIDARTGAKNIRLGYNLEVTPAQ